MRATPLVALLALISAGAVARQHVPPPSRTLDLSMAVDSIRPCGERDDRVDEDIVDLRLRLRNRASAPVRVLPDTLRLTSVQVVRTVEQIVPMGADTPGVRVLPMRRDTAGTKGAARLLRPGESLDVMAGVAVAIADPAASGRVDALEPGHHFLELVVVIESAAQGGSRFAAESIVSPYIGVDIGATPRVSCTL